MTSQFNIKQAICNIIAEVQKGERTNVSDALLSTFKNREDYVIAAVQSAIASDTGKITKSLRNAGQIVGVQLSFPGFENASLPALVIVTDPDSGEETAIGWTNATKEQHKKEVARQRRSLNVRLAVVETYEKTLAHMDEIGAPDDWTAAKIKAEYGADE